MITITSDYDFKMIARNFYNNHAGNTEYDFEKDLKLFNTMKNQLLKYISGEKDNIRIILNTYITLSNVFSIAADVMLRYKMPHHLHPYIAVFPKIFKGKIEDKNCFSYEFYQDVMEIL